MYFVPKYVIFNNNDILYLIPYIWDDLTHMTFSSLTVCHLK